MRDVVLRIPAPYDFELSLARYRLFGSDGATVWHEGGLHRVVAGREVRIEAAAGGVRSSRGRRGRGRGRPSARALVRPRAFHAWAIRIRFSAGDPVASRLPSTLNPQPFEALVVAITTQQISLRAAAAIRGRFVRRFGTKHDLAWEFPTRERIGRTRPGDITAIGFSARKAEYVVALARSELDLDALETLPDDDVVTALTALPGLGRWTADWYLARHLARPEAWPAGDLGLRKAVAAFYADGRSPSIEEVRSMGDRFAPFQNLSAQFLLMGARMVG